MRKLLSIVLGLILSVGIISTVRAEQSATGYENPPYTGDYQVFVVAYNSYNATIARNNVVVLDNTGATTTLRSGTLGAYVNLTNTTDSVFVYGVSDEDIAPGSMGRVCVRGPHKAVSIAGNIGAQATGAIISASNIAGKYGFYSTADGTTGARLGYVLNTTASTDTGDASNTYWVWVNPEVHK